MNEELLEVLNRIVSALDRIAKNTEPGDDEKNDKKVKGFGL